MIPESLTIPELKEDLQRLQQALENGDITDQQFEAGAADLHQRIKARELAIAKGKVVDYLEALKKAGKIDRVPHAQSRMAIANAKNAAELEAIHFNLSSL